MKTYESATIVDLGNASDLVLGIDGQGPDSPPFVNFLLDEPTFADVDE